MEQPQLNIDFSTTTGVEGFNGGQLFGQAFIIRKISKFVIGADEDAMMPIPVFYDQYLTLLINILRKNNKIANASKSLY